MDSDNISVNFVPQILTEKKGGSLDARKCFIFLRIHGFGVPHVICVFLFGDLMGFRHILLY